MRSPLPAVRKNVAELARIITEPPVNLVSAGRCYQMVDSPNIREAGISIRSRCQEAQDLLLVYYAGHGLLDDNGELFLALPDTDYPDNLEFTAIPFKWLRDAMRKSQAQTRVLILDCCFAGQIFNDRLSATGAERVLADRSAVVGTYVLTATNAITEAQAPGGAEFTAFTGELIHLLHSGSPTGSDLTLEVLYYYLRVRLTASGFPEPQQRNTDLASHLILRPGRRATTGDASEGGSEHISPTVGQGPTTPISALHSGSTREMVNDFHRPSTPFNLVQRRLLATQWKRFAVALIGLAVWVIGLVVWRAVAGHGPPTGQNVVDASALSYQVNWAALVLGGVATAALVVGAIWGRRRGNYRDATIEWITVLFMWGPGFVAFGIGGALVELEDFIDIPLPLIVAIDIPLIVAYLMIGIGFAIARRGIRYLEEALGDDLPAVRRVWNAGLVLFLEAYLIFYYSYRTHRTAAVIVVLAIIAATGGLICVTSVRAYDCISGHIALSRRPLAITLSMRGVGITARDERRFVAWHDIDRIFIEGNLLAIDFKRDYPEVEKPPELDYRPSIGGFAIADIRQFPNARVDVVRSVAYFAGSVFHGVSDPSPETTSILVTPGGGKARWYHESWESQ